MASTLAYYDTATITAVKSFIVQAPGPRLQKNLTINYLGTLSRKASLRKISFATNAFFEDKFQLIVSCIVSLLYTNYISLMKWSSLPNL